MARNKAILNYKKKKNQKQSRYSVIVYKYLYLQQIDLTYNRSINIFTLIINNYYYKYLKCMPVRIA